MTGQMNIYDFLPEFDPVGNLAHKLVWGDGRTPTRNRLLRYLNDNELTADVVRREYCPYGAAGEVGQDKPMTVHEYHMSNEGTAIRWTDYSENAKHKFVTWQQLTRAIRRELEEGEKE